MSLKLFSAMSDDVRKKSEHKKISLLKNYVFTIAYLNTFIHFKKKKIILKRQLQSQVDCIFVVHSNYNSKIICLRLKIFSNEVYNKTIKHESFFW